MEQIEVQTEFAKDALHGLSAKPKYLSSKYFYDDRGSQIFQDIMRMPEYYLTDCELEIFQTQKRSIFEEFVKSSDGFELVELGAGDGLKTKILLTHFLNQQVDFRYAPIDISRVAIENLVNDLNKQIPDLKVKGRIGDYFELMKEIEINGYSRKIILFLGSNIGNYSPEESISFLDNLKAVMQNQDMVFIGFDLKKESHIILNAYNDPHGHTAAFNLNLLQRINTELDANFDLNNFSHKELYNSDSGTAKSYLMSKIAQEVNIQSLDKTIHFEDGEKVFMERSQKYDLEMINKLAEKSGFEIVRNFFDQRQYFVNSLWKIK
ncbi:MAG: L-histidine N(alpha)-methyltransferase [Bacteroidales bacterium]|jgi:L-histidine N-alpha-methyltransferase|nr:L-histidine N(alpha)-methyltransferase [Bacteroidales bacterium]